MYSINGIFIDVPSYIVIESALRGATLASNYVFLHLNGKTIFEAIIRVIRATLGTFGHFLNHYSLFFRVS